MTVANGALAPFSVRSFRFQWPADLATAWAAETEVLILAWYILTTTGSVQTLVAFASLAWLGTLFSPFFGMGADRLGARAMLCIARGGYAALAGTLTVLSWTGTLQTWHIFVIAALAGLMRPSDVVMRNVLVAQTMPRDVLLGALGINRTTTDSAKIAGAVAGTAGVALLGMAPAYLIVTILYLVAFLLTLGVAGAPGGAAQLPARVIADIKDGFRYAWRSPEQLAAFSIAFLVNLLAYPLYLGLLPYVARDVFHSGQAGLGYMAAAFAVGALAGSLLVSARLRLRAGRSMLGYCAVWFVLFLAFGLTRSMEFGLVLLFGAGVAQSLCLVPLAAVMLRSASEEMRGRMMGMRSLAVWGLPVGILLIGPLVEHLGYTTAMMTYGGLGLAATLYIGWHWRQSLWRRSAAANSV